MPRRPFPGGAQHIHDDAAALRLEHGIDRAAEVDVAEHLEVPRGAPARLVDRLQVAGRDGAGVVHQDVDVAARRRQRPHSVTVAEIDRMDRHRDVVAGLNGLPGLVEVGLGARREVEVAAFLGELAGAGKPDALGRAGDESGLAAQMKIHGVLPPNDVLEPPGSMGQNAGGQ
jgi:hypothetical protein